MRFDCTGDHLSEMEEHEGTVSGETVSQATTVWMFLNSRCESGRRAVHLVMNVERLKQWHDSKTGAIKITCGRAAAGACTLARKLSNSGTQPINVDAISKGTGKGSRQRVANLSQLWKTWTPDEKTVGRAKARKLEAKERATWDSEHCQLLEKRKPWSLWTRLQKHRNCR